MYERFFGLSDAPFRLTPDPRYLFLSRRHADALAHLRLGLEESGFVCLTGDVGTGKTTLLRAFLAQLGPEIAAAYVFNPALSPLELLRTLNAEFGLRAASAPAEAQLGPLRPPAGAARGGPALRRGDRRGAGARHRGARAAPAALEPRDRYREAAAHHPGRPAAAPGAPAPSRAGAAQPAHHAALAHRTARA